MGDGGTEVTEMTTDEKMKLLESMPDDYMPKKSPDFVPVYFEFERGFNRLSDEQAGAVLKRLYQYARDYAMSYDASLIPDYDGLDAGAEMLLEMMAGSVRRVYSGMRDTSYLRSGANNAGRPSKT